jgi:hemerythrin-like domain-containing protein
MVEEHRNIKRMLQVIRKVCYKIVKGEDIEFEDFYRIIDFVRNYADKHHHGKEESMLFNRMSEELGAAAQKLVNSGMLVEHDLGRLYMRQLEAAVKSLQSGDDEAIIDVIGNAMSYENLLNRHIDKEDGVVYKFAANNLSKETKERIERECEAFENTSESAEAREKYINLLNEFEIKYL